MYKATGKFFNKLWNSTKKRKTVTAIKPVSKGKQKKRPKPHAVVLKKLEQRIEQYRKEREKTQSVFENTSESRDRCVGIQQAKCSEK